MASPRPGMARFWVADIPKNLMRLLERHRQHKGKFKGAFVATMVKEYCDKHKDDLPAEEQKA